MKPYITIESALQAIRTANQTRRIAYDILSKETGLPIERCKEALRQIASDGYITISEDGRHCGNTAKGREVLCQSILDIYYSKLANGSLGQGHIEESATTLGD